MSLYSEWEKICKDYEFPQSHYYKSDLLEVLKMFSFLKSQYGELLKVVDEINIKIEKVDEQIASDIEKALKPYIERINKIVIDTDSKIEELENFVKRENASTISKVEVIVTDESIKRITGDLELFNLINESVEELQKAFNELERKVIESGLAIVNPRRSKVQTVQEVVNDLYLAILQNGSFTSSELSEYPTCDTIRTEYMTFDEFAVSNRRLKDRLINNPITGKKGSIEYALSSLKGYNQPLGLTNDEMREYAITNNEIANALLNYTLFLCRSGVVLHSDKVNLGLWKDGKELFLSTFSKSSTVELETVIELDENVDRIIDVIVLKTDNNGNVEDITNSVVIDIDTNTIIVSATSDSVVYDVKILWT